MLQSKVALLADYGDINQFYMDSIPLPLPGPGQVRLRVAGAAVNPVDIKTRKGFLKDWIPISFPAQLGCDVAGVVDAVGDGVTDLKPGDRVAGLCNPVQGGAYAQYVNTFAAALVKVPEALDLIDAAAAPTGALTGSQLIERAIAPKAGDRVLVLGAGGSTGRAAVFAAVDAGATVFAAIRPSSRQAVADLPLAGILDVEDVSSFERIDQFNALADTVGGATAEGLIKYIKPTGAIASIAVPGIELPAGSTQKLTQYVVQFDADRLAKFYVDLLRFNRNLPVAKRLPLDEVGEAHRLAEEGGLGGKIVLIP